jgi:ribosome maturation factor RimP
MELPKTIEDEIERIIESEGLELVHLQLKRQGRAWLFRVDIDKEGGVNVDDCVLISNQLSTFLDVADPIPGEFELQVSSPGLDRKFYRDSDYTKFTGRLVRVHSTKPVKGINVIIGHLTAFDGERVTVVDPQSGKDYEVPLSDIKETRLEVEI